LHATIYLANQGNNYNYKIYTDLYQYMYRSTCLFTAGLTAIWIEWVSNCVSATRVGEFAAELLRQMRRWTLLLFIRQNHRRQGWKWVRRHCSTDIGFIISQYGQAVRHSLRRVCDRQFHFRCSIRPAELVDNSTIFVRTIREHLRRFMTSVFDPDRGLTLDWPLSTPFFTASNIFLNFILFVTVRVCHMEKTCIFNPLKYSLY